jgi:hypothetical protein
MYGSRDRQRRHQIGQPSERVRFFKYFERCDGEREESEYDRARGLGLHVGSGGLLRWRSGSSAFHADALHET